MTSSSTSMILPLRGEEAARRAAQQILESLGYDRPPIDPQVIADTFGIGTLFVEFTGTLTDKIAGFFDPEGNDIVVNRSLDAREKLFVIAHQLGLHLLHRSYLESDRYRALKRPIVPGAWRTDEQGEAAAFAHELLVPGPALRHFRPIASLPELSQIFCVPEAMILSQAIRL